jgi:O-antigen/teichoic acid export membrane protein
MSNARRIAANTVVQVAGRLIGTLLALVTLGIMTRHLGPAGYGHFTIAVSFLQFTGVLVDFGLTLTMTRLLSLKDADEPRIAGGIMTVRALTGLVFFGLAPMAALAFPYPPELQTAIAVGAVSFLAMSLSSVLGGVFQKHLATHFVALAEVAGRAVLLLGVWYGAAHGAGLVAYMAVLAIANLIQFGLSTWFAGRIVRLRPRFDLSLWRLIARESWPIAVSIALNLVYLKGDVVVLSIFREADEVGLYGAPYKVLDVVTVLPTIFMGLMLPPMTGDWSHGRHEAFREKLRRALDIMLLLALPLFGGAVAVAEPLMTLVAGPEYAASGTYLAILMLAAVFVSVGSVYGYAVVALGLQRRMIWAYGAVAAAATVLYLAFVPHFGALAAAWVTVATEGLVALLLGVAVIRHTKVWPRAAVPLKAGFAALLMHWCLTYTGDWHVAWRIAAGAVIYAALAFALRIVPIKDLRALVVRP